MSESFFLHPDLPSNDLSLFSRDTIPRALTTHFRPRLSTTRELTTMAPSTLTVGALVFEYQGIDVVGPLDLLCSSSHGLLSAMRNFIPIPDSTFTAAPHVEFHHIGITLDPVPLATSGFILKPSVTVEDCPPLDVLLVGGPDPTNFVLHEKFKEFVRKHVREGKTLWTNCTGAGVVA
jgi:hypothetical protein